VPNWIQNPDGSVQYVDEYGQPAAPPPVPVQEAVPGELDQLPVDPATQPLAPMPSRNMAVADLPAVAPAQPIPQPAQPGALNPALLQNGTSVSQSVAAFQPGRFQQVEGTTTGLRGAQAQAKQRADAGAANESQFTAAIGADQARAAQGLGDAEAMKESARAEQFRQQANLASMFAAAESSAAAIAADKTSGYRARFEQSLAQATAMRIDPRLQFNKTDELSAIGLLFTQGFLQAQGTPVYDAQKMISGLIDRKVDRDMQAIQQGHKLAEGQRMLWDMARAEAGDEAEARQRYRTLTMAQAAADMEATTAQFGSMIATAKGKAAAADIRVAVNKDLADITDRYFKRYMSESGLALDEWKAKVAASQESQRIGLAKRELDAKLGAGAPVPTENVVFDVTESGDRVAKWKFIDGLSDAKRGELLDRMSGKATFVSNLRELRAMAEQAGKIPGGWGQAMTNSAFEKRVRNLANGMAASYVRAMSGAAATDSERKTLSERIPINTILQNDGAEYVRRGLADFQKEVIKETNNTIGQFATDIAPGTPESQLRGGSPNWASAEETEADILRDGRDEVKTTIQQAAEKLLAPAAAQEPVGVTRLWKEVGNPVNAEAERGRLTGAQSLAGAEVIPGWAPAMEDLFYQAVDPRTKGTELSDAARNALIDVRGNTSDPVKQDYANDLLNLIDNPAPQGPSHLGGFLTDLELGALAE
jgi:hypothetical protein